VNDFSGVPASQQGGRRVGGLFNHLHNHLGRGGIVGQGGGVANMFAQGLPAEPDAADEQEADAEQQPLPGFESRFHDGFSWMGGIRRGIIPEGGIRQVAFTNQWYVGQWFNMVKKAITAVAKMNTKASDKRAQSAPQ